MGTVGLILMGIGGIALFIFSIMLLIEAFKESVLWGLGYLFVPFVSLIFVIMHWDKAKGPFIKLVVSAVVFFIGSAVAGAGAADSLPPVQ